jgi:hypothetical protein
MSTELYNGIALPDEWPPDYGPVTREPMPVPYLRHRPAVIPIDVGRQLFIDDWLVEETTLTRTWHRAELVSANPILRADQPWEADGDSTKAAPFSDGVWYDPRDGKIKMWYLAGPCLYTCFAESRDGIHWQKPLLDVVPGTNIVLTAPRDSSTVWLDEQESDPQRRYKMFPTMRTSHWQLGLRFSPDGIHWSEPVATSGRIGDRTTVFYNPFREKWVWSLRDHPPRKRAYHESADPVQGTNEARSEIGPGIVPWVGADRCDPSNPDPQFSAIEPQLYNLDAVAYESIMLGLFSVWQGPENPEMRALGIRKRNDVLLGYSRDGFHWDRPDRRRFISCHAVEGAWNWGNMQTAGGGCLVMGDKLYFYVSGRSLRPNGAGDMTTGLGILRRDGFASMDADEAGGSLTTRRVRFQGKHLFVNVDAGEGELRVEILGEDGQPLGRYTREACKAVRANKTLVEVTWEGADDVAALAGQPVRFRFSLQKGRLYAFWVSPERSGASQGYVAAGGPGFAGSRDTVGDAAYAAFAALG